MLRRRRGAADKCHGLCGEHSQCSGHTGFAPCSAACVLSPSTLLRLQAALRGRVLSCVPFPGLRRSGSGFRVFHKDADSVGPAFRAFPAEQLGQPGACGAHSLQVQRALSPPRPQPQFPGALVGGTLCPFREADFWLRAIQNLRKSWVRSWEPVCRLVGDAVSGDEFAPFPSPLPLASSGGWAGPPPASSSLVFAQSFVLGTGG